MQFSVYEGVLRLTDFVHQQIAHNCDAEAVLKTWIRTINQYKLQLVFKAQRYIYDGEHSSILSMQNVRLRFVDFNLRLNWYHF